MRSSKAKVYSHITNFLALVGVVSVLAIILSILSAKPYLTESGPLTSASHTVMITAITLAATLFSGLMASRLRHLLLGIVDKKLRNSIIRLGTGEETESNVSRLDRRWRGILGIDSVSEKAHNLPVVLAYFVCALMTTAIVTTFTPITTTKSIRYHPLTPDANYATNITCVFMTDATNFSSLQAVVYNWTMSNGSHFVVPTSWGGCPTRFAEILSGNINPLSPLDYAYSDMGVAVQNSAIGAPISIYSSKPNGSIPLSNLLQSYGTSLLNTTQCVPVMIKNPIRCNTGGNIILGKSGNHSFDSLITVASTDQTCSFTWWYNGVNVTDPGAYVMLNTFCPSTKPDTIGKGTMLFSGLYTYGFWLASFINDPDITYRNASETPLDFKYAVTCSVDTTDVFAYRKVSLSLQRSAQSANNSFSRILYSDGEECIPSQPTISNIMFATAAAANWQLITQNLGIDGLIDSISQQTMNWRDPPYAFNNSRNALEDVLGLAAALVVSRLNNSGQYVPAESSTEGEWAYISATRLGGGQPESFLLVLPPLLTAAILISLMIMSERAEFNSDSDARSSMYSDLRNRPYTESLQGLLQLGGFLSPVENKGISEVDIVQESIAEDMEQEIIPDHMNVRSLNGEQKRLLQDEDLARWMVF